MNDFKNKMNEKIKLYSNKQYLDGYIKNEFLTDDSDADIYLNIDDKDELFDTWTVGNQVDLESNIYEYIEEKTAMLDNDVQINLHIIGTELTSKEQGVIRHILKEHYAIELYKIQKQFNKYKKKIISLFCIGVLSVIGYLIIYLNTNLDFFLEVFGFIFSFALWEGFDALIYDFSEIKNEREAVTQNLLIDVDFKYKEKDK